MKSAAGRPGSLDLVGSPARVLSASLYISATTIADSSLIQAGYGEMRIV
jgi:hypothetical protein